MNLTILATAICLSLLSCAAPMRVLCQTEPQTEPTLTKLPSSLEQLTRRSQVQQFQKLIQQEPLLYLFLQLEQVPMPNLQQQAEAEIRQTLQQTPSLQQQLIQQEIHGKVRLDDLNGKKPK